MKKKNLLVLTTLLVLGLMAGGVTSAAASVENVDVGIGSSPSIEFTGVVESIDGDQVTVDGQTVTVDSALIESAGFAVGDLVEVEASMDENGVLVAKSVELEDSSDHAYDDSSDHAYDDSSDHAYDDSSDHAYDDSSGHAYDDSSDHAYDDDSSDHAYDDDSSDHAHDDHSSDHDSSSHSDDDDGDHSSSSDVIPTPAPGS